LGRFFIIAGAVVAGLVLAPVILLSLRHEDSYENKVVYHSSYGAKVRSIDPATCGDTTSAAVQGNVYEALFAYHYLKRPAELIAQLAESLGTISGDGLTFTVRIRKGINYGRNRCFGLEPDGQTPKTRAVRATDFVLAFKRIADFHIQTQLSWSFLSGRIKGLDEFRRKTEQYDEGDFGRYDLEVAGLRALDEHTLQIELTAPYPQLPHVLAMHTYAPVPREAIDYYLAAEPVETRTARITRIEQMTGTGPYVLTKWERGSRMVFERNEQYQHGFYPNDGSPGDEEAGLLADAGKALPFIDVLDFKCVLEDLPGWLRFLSRQSDVSGIPRDVFEGVITPERTLSDAWQRKGIRLETFDVPVVFWLVFNMEDPVLKASKSLRQAMCLGYNVEDYIEVLFNGRARRAVNVLPRSFPTHAAAGPGPYCRFDPKAAKAKLQAAKEELHAAGLLGANGEIPELTIDLAGRDESYRRMGEFTQQQFSVLALRVKIVLNDWPTLQQKVHNKQCQVYGMGWHADYPDGENFLQLFYSPNIEKGTNNSNYSDSEFDKLYEKAKVMQDSPERRRLYVRMIRRLSEDCPVLLLTEPKYFVLVYDWVGNYKRHPFGYGMIKYLQLDTKLRREMGGP